MDDCIFCRIVKGELPASKIHEDEHTLSFMNIMAAHPGHALVIVKPHRKDIFELDDTLSAAVFQANEVAGGQTVFHFHIHVLPRFNDDKLLPFWPASAPNRAALDAMAERLREAL